MVAAPPVAAGVALRSTLERLAAGDEYLRVRFGAPVDEGWSRANELTAADSPHLDRLFGQVGAAHATAKRDVMASFCFGSIGWLVAAVAVGAYLVDRRVPTLAPESVLFRFNEQGMATEATLLSDRFAALPNDPAAGDPAATIVPGEGELRAVLRGELAGHLAPLVDAVRARAPLGTRALWLAVADDVAWAAIQHTKEGGNLDRTRATVLALIDDRAAPWRGRTGVIEVAWREKRECFVERAACCLSYKLPTAEKCTTCPLRPAEERFSRLQTYLAEQS